MLDRRCLITSTAIALLLGTSRLGAAAAPLPKTYSGQTITVLTGTGPAFDYLKELSADFMAQTGVTVEFTGLSYNEQYQKLILDLTSGGGSFDAFAFAYQWKHEIAPYAADLSKTVAGAPDLALADYPPRVLDVYSKVDGKLIGLPFLGDVTLLVWNKDQYKAAGLDPSVAPTSWAEILENGRKLERNGHYGFGLPAGKSAQTANIWMLDFAARGGAYFDAAFRPQFNSPAGKAAMTFIVKELQTIAPPGNLTWDFPEMLNSLTTGQAAQGMMWPGGFGALLDPSQSSTAKSVAWAPMPGAALLGGWSLGVSEASRNKDAAKLYAAWLTSPETQRKAAKLGGSPARISTLSDPELVKEHPYWPVVLQGMQGQVTEFPPVKEAEQVVIMIYDEVNAAAAGLKTPDEASDALQAKVVEFVKAAGSLK